MSFMGAVRNGPKSTATMIIPVSFTGGRSYMARPVMTPVDPSRAHGGFSGSTRTFTARLKLARKSIAAFTMHHLSSTNQPAYVEKKAKNPVSGHTEIALTRKTVCASRMKKLSTEKLSPRLRITIVRSMTRAHLVHVNIPSHPRDRLDCLKCSMGSQRWIQ